MSSSDFVRPQKFKIWEDNQEQWDPADIDPPAMVVDAFSAGSAAEKYAKEKGSSFDDEIYVIVQDSAGNYSRCEVVKSWELNQINETSLEELCSE